MIIKDKNNVNIQITDSHPRLLVSDTTFVNIKENISTDTNLSNWFNMIKNKVDKLLLTKPTGYTMKDSFRLDTSSSYNVIELSFMYKITNDMKYANRAWDEIYSIINYKDWNSKHFLDTCMISYGLAIGYDWLYHVLSRSQRNMIENAIINKSLNIGICYYKNNSHFFVKDKYNWNFVCNTGLILSAISILDSNPIICEDIIKEGFESIKNGMVQYAPEGDSIEGISYWDYGTKFLIYFLSTLSISTNRLYDYINTPGIKETPEFPIHMCGKVQSYNYSDNDVNYPIGYINLWFAKYLNKPELTWYHKHYMRNKGSISIYDILWYDKSLYNTNILPKLDNIYSRQAITTMRSDWNDINTSFIGCKGGINGSPHGDLDIGSFVYDTLGERWAIDLGKENYNLPGYWEKDINGRRWHYYRKNNKGHNTLVINNENQIENAISEIFDSNINFNTFSPYTKINMTNAYSESKSIIRLFHFLERKHLLIKDEISLKKCKEVIWQMHTKSNIDIISDKELRLSMNGKSIYISILDNDNSKFEILDVKFTSMEKYDKDIKKIIIRKTIKDGNFKVLIKNDLNFKI